MGALYQTRISLLLPREITAMHATCLKTFPENEHTSQYERGNTCEPKKE